MSDAQVSEKFTGRIFSPWKIILLLVAAALCYLVLTNKRNEDKFPVVRGFYYWKNTSDGLDSVEKAGLKDLGIKKLYVKFFEVSRDSVYGNIPVAKTELRIEDYNDTINQRDSLLRRTMHHLEIIPTVFVKNEVLHSSSHEELDSLSDNICYLVQKYFDEKIADPFFCYNELQIDCDWTIKTKDNYFYLLRSIKQRSKKTLSCTLRLYPYKFPNVMGVPPVDKATLMCYNLISPMQSGDKSSILDTAELKKYLAGAKPYPLHLDIALPVFSWMQVYRNGDLIGMVDPGELSPGTMRHVRSYWYEATAYVETDRMYIQPRDELKWERVSEADLSSSIRMIKKYVKLSDFSTVTLFHLDSDILQSYSHETIDSCFTAFAQR